LKLLVTAGQCGDAPQAQSLLEDLKPGTVQHVLADTADDSNAIRQQVRQLQAKACIRPNATRKTRKRFDRGRYKHRNVVERFFGRIKRFRRVATRYEKKPQNFTGFVWLAALLTEELLNVRTA